MEKEIILKSDPRSAEKVTLWKSTKGNYFHTEESARYDSCTHTRICECGSGKPVSKGWTTCEDCIREKDRQRYLSLPEGELEFPCAIFEDDTYFNDEDDIEYYCEDHEIEPDQLRLVNTAPVHLHEVDLDYWADKFPGDWDGEDILSDALSTKLGELNEIIRDHAAVSYSPSKVRVNYSR